MHFKSWSSNHFQVHYQYHSVDAMPLSSSSSSSFKPKPGFLNSFVPQRDGLGPLGDERSVAPRYASGNFDCHRLGTHGDEFGKRRAAGKTNLRGPKTVYKKGWQQQQQHNNNNNKSLEASSNEPMQVENAAVTTTAALPITHAAPPPPQQQQQPPPLQHIFPRTPENERKRAAVYLTQHPGTGSPSNPPRAEKEPRLSTGVMDDDVSSFAFPSTDTVATQASNLTGTSALQMPPPPPRPVNVTTTSPAATASPSPSTASPSSSNNNNPLAKQPWLPNKTMGVPKSALSAWYNQKPRHCQLSKDCFISWNNGGLAHQLKFTSVFVCPLTGEIFASGRYGETVEYKTSMDEGNGAEIVWYSEYPIVCVGRIPLVSCFVANAPGLLDVPTHTDTKKLAEHGAASRAYDCFSYRQYFGTGMNSVHLGTEQPYLPKEQAQRLNQPGPPQLPTLPPNVENKVQHLLQKVRVRKELKAVNADQQKLARQHEMQQQQQQYQQQQRHPFQPPFQQRQQQQQQQQQQTGGGGGIHDDALEDSMDVDRQEYRHARNSGF